MIMEYDLNRIEFVKTQKKTSYKQVNIFFKCIDSIIHNEIFLKVIFSLSSNIFCEMFYLLRCFMFAELKCF